MIFRFQFRCLIAAGALFSTALHDSQLFADEASPPPASSSKELSTAASHNIRTTDLCIETFGAQGDGHTLNTRAFADAVAECARNGGGTVIIPAGRFLTGTIELPSHVHLCLEPGAMLLASTRSEDYPDAENPWAPGKKGTASLIYAHDAVDVGISGTGTIDGQGASWWAPVLAEKAAKGKEKSASSQPDQAAILKRDRPQLMRFLRCSDVLIQSVHLVDSPEWNVHPIFCERVRVDGISIHAKLPAPNTDGIDPESCRNVQITNCCIDTGDDCITLKSGLNESGRRMGRPDEDITISNCVMYHGHGGVTIGSEMSGGVRNVTVSDCVFHGTDIGIRIKSQRGRGGVVESIAFDNILMDHVPHPFVITSFYMGKDKPGDTFPVDDTTPRFRNILISDVLATAAEDVGSLTGLREMPVTQVTFSNVHVEAQKGMAITNASKIVFHDSTFHVAQGDMLITKDVRKVEASDLQKDSDE